MHTDDKELPTHAAKSTAHDAIPSTKPVVPPPTETSEKSDNSLHIKLKYVTLVRGAYALLVLSYTIVWFIRMDVTRVTDEALLLLGGVSEILVFTTICCICLLRNKFVSPLTYIGMVHDSLLVAFIVVLTGFSASPFFYLFLIVPLYGGITLQRRGGLIGATIVSIVMFCTLYVQAIPYHEIKALADLPTPNLVGGYYLSYLILAAYCVGFLTGHLSHLYTSVSHSLALADAEFTHLKGIYSILLNALPIGVIIVNPATNRVVFHNPSARTLLGDALEIPRTPISSLANRSVSRDEVPQFQTSTETLQTAPNPEDSGLGFKNNMHPQCCAMRDIQQMQSSHDAIQTSSNEWTSYTNHRYLHIAQFKLPIQQYEFVGYHITDMTAQYKAQRERAQRARLEHLGEFSAKVAHEIRNPLSCVSGCNEMLQYLTDKDEIAQVHEMMSGEIARLNNMLNDILVFSRKPKLNVKRLRLEDVIRSQWKLFGEHTKFKDMKIECDIPDDYCIEFDETSLRQIAMTMWQNSAEANSGRATVTIRADESGTIAFSDSGRGIAEEDALRVFEPFYTTKTSGTGLGLATAKQYANDNVYALSWSTSQRAFIVERNDTRFQTPVPQKNGDRNAVAVLSH